MSKAKDHVPALDGLRGLALAGVLAFHAGGALPGGYLGVDLFFVLSGFLITRLLLVEASETGRIDLKRFWLRRARRLVPALLLLMPAIALYARFVARPDEVHGIRWDALATLGYVANWREAFASGSYWEIFTAPSPLQHTWSLAIEEQFYVVWPLVVLACLRVAGRRGLAALTLALAVASATAMLALHAPDRTSRVYFGTDTRATGILLGALFAMAMSWRPGSIGAWLGSDTRRARVLDAIGLVATATIGWAWLRMDGEHPLLYRGGFWITEVAALGLIACALAAPASIVGRALAFAPLRWLGLISYGAYLWHWPVHLVVDEARTGLHGVALEAARFAATIGLALASYLLVEKPIRAGRTVVARSPAIAGAAVAAVVSAIVAGTLPRPVPLHLAHVMEERWVRLAVQGQAPARIRVAVHGDSTANSLGWTLRGLRDPGLTVLLEGDDGFNVINHEPSPWPPREADVRVVVLGGSFLYGIRVDGKWTKACHPEWNRRFEERLGSWLSGAGSRSEPLWVATVPYPLGRYDTPAYRAEVDCINRSVRTVAASQHLRVLELGDMLCPGGACRRAEGGVELRPDGVHYDLEGARGLGREVLERLEQGQPKG